MHAYVASPDGSHRPSQTSRLLLPDLTDKNFGLLIAYGIPGFIALWGASYISPTVGSWLSPSPDFPGNLESVFFVTTASIAAGMAVSAVRWAVIDHLHQLTGIRRPNWDDANLQPNIDAFETIVEHQYRYYQHHANAAVALAFAVAAWHYARPHPLAIVPHVDGLFAGIEVVLIATSRDNLRKYYARASRILGPYTPHEERRFTMSNGSHPKPSQSSQGTAKPAGSSAKPTIKPVKS